MNDKWYNMARLRNGLYDCSRCFILKGDLMFEKIIDFMWSGAWTRKISIFFAMFAMTLTVMGGVFGTNAGGELPADASGADLSPEPETVIAETARTGITQRDNRDEVHASFSTGFYMEQKNTAEITESESSEEERLKEEVQTDKDSGQSRVQDVFVYNESIPMNYELQEYTYNKCVERGLEYELVLAIMWRESRFDPDAVNINANGTRDNGIMQINDINRSWLYKRYGIEDLMDPYQNIDAGTAMLGMLGEKYGIHGAMLAYQYGESGMVRRIREGHTTSRAVEEAYRQRDYYRQFV